VNLVGHLAVKEKVTGLKAVAERDSSKNPAWMMARSVLSLFLNKNLTEPADR
jgi:hypothetical protein